MKNITDYRSECIPALMTSDSIYLLPDWGQSRGARIEYAIAREMGLEIIFSDNDVFDYRYRNNKRTIITTNLTPSEIEETYGTRIIDRFRECMNDLVLDGESFRR